MLEFSAFTMAAVFGVCCSSAAYCFIQAARKHLKIRAKAKLERDETERWELWESYLGAVRERDAIYTKDGLQQTRHACSCGRTQYLPCGESCQEE